MSLTGKAAFQAAVPHHRIPPPYPPLDTARPPPPRWRLSQSAMHRCNGVRHRYTPAAWKAAILSQLERRYICAWPRFSTIHSIPEIQSKNRRIEKFGACAAPFLLFSLLKNYPIASRAQPFNLSTLQPFNLSTPPHPHWYWQHFHIGNIPHPSPP